MKAGRAALAHGLMVASGFAGLGYQIVWTQQCGLWLGHEAAAVLAVVAAFFGGLAVGALALAPAIERSTRPGRWYAACEAVIGLWGAVLIVAMAPAGAALLALTGPQPAPAWQWGVAFAGCFVLLLPATAAMGATLPAMQRLGGATGERLPSLYAANTFGAVLGVLAAAFWLVPAFGLAHTAALCVALNLVCAAAAGAAFRDTQPPAAAAWPAPAALGRLAACGLLGIGYEVLVVRVLSQVTEDTVYSFALLLAVYLVGSAAGAAAYQRWGRHGEATTRRLLAVLALAGLLGTAALYGAEDLRQAVLHTLGGGVAAALAAEAALAVAAFLLPTLAMGALFSHLAREAVAGGASLGRCLGVNTLGAALAPPVFGVLAVPALGVKLAVLLAVAGYLLLAGRPRGPAVPVLAGAAAVLALAAPPLAFIDVPEGGRVLSYREGAVAAVSVVEDADGVRRLRINNRQQEGSSATAWFDGRQALLPLMLHPAPRRALFLGLGTGATARTAALDPALQVDAAELLPEVIEAAPLFAAPGAEAAPANLHVMAADARRIVRAGGPPYDVIVSDNFHPARSGSAALYTVEHFRAVRERLTPEGVFCQWLPLHQMDAATLKSIVRAFATVYPQGWALLANNSLQTPTVGLVGLREGRRFDPARVRRRLAAAPPALAGGFGLEDEFALLGSFVAGPHALAAFAAGAPVNTDDRPIVAYLAPRATYAPEADPGTRLARLLDAWTLAPDELLADGAEPDGRARLAAYGQARRRFIAAGQGVRPSADVREMLARVGPQLLGVLRISPDFRPAYDPLLRMAQALAGIDREAARRLLAEMARVQPQRPEAQQALHEIGALP